MNRRPPPLSRLLTQLRGMISLDPADVRRRDLGSARQSEVQLEFDLVLSHWDSPALRSQKVGRDTIDLSIS